MTKTIFITGTTSGFGKAMTELFAQNGWRVAATYRRREVADHLFNTANVTPYELDVRNEEQVKKVCQQVINDLGVPDVIVNNAGYCLIGSLESSTMEQIREQFETNFFGLVAVTKEFLPHLRKRKSGTIVNIASSSALGNYPFVPVYGASKSAVRGLSESLYLELAPFNIKVKTVFPGLHSTKIFTKLDSAVGQGHQAYAPYFKNFEELQSASGKSGDPLQVARTIYDAVTSGEDKRDYVVNRDAKMLVISKALLSDRLWKKMNVSMIHRKPTALLKAIMKWQINGTKNLDFEPSPLLSSETN